jgi:hypothetical protein
LTDAVEKLSDTQRAGNNRIQFLHSLNQCCAPASYLESMLLTRASKNLFRQHRSLADMSGCVKKRPLYPRKQTFREATKLVRHVP